MEHTYHYKYKKYKSLYKMGGGRDDDDDNDEFFPSETIESDISDFYMIDDRVHNVSDNTLYTIEEWREHFEIMSVDDDSGIDQIVIIDGLPLENPRIPVESLFLERIRSIGSLFVGNEELVGVLVDTRNGHKLYFRDRTAPERLSTGQYTPFICKSIEEPLVPDIASAAGGSYY